MDNRIFLFLTLFFLSTLLPAAVFGQSDKYIITHEDKLQIVVYVLGEVNRPGEYKVPDDIDLVELLSHAGGATQFGNLGKVTINRHINPVIAGAGMLPATQQRSIIKFDVKKYLSDVKSEAPPLLQPGDVIYVPKNSWFKWRSAATILRDVSVVASAYFLYRRAMKD
ncbi:MAG: hypothetical protein Kow0037_25610 [Calditrichia bacterium]